ncbi:MAG: ABC transporter substrate-binding protein [Betaproteobacteria bacterium HGW-Betaproteobacteria-11]|nr:MAG: ABC transporter substrate-binding protein [Betaproteobacteria bacterium HGW-Betaproteobacteria-11]
MRGIRSYLNNLLAGVALAALAATGSAQARPNDLADLQQRGQISFAFYNTFAPFSNKGKGADVEIAEALAARLGLKMSALWFDADENMEDDLRNMVWKGHYLGYGPADVMIHVPIDHNYMAKLDKVSFFAPYHRERYAIARNLDRVPTLDSLAPLENQPIGVEGDSLPATVMLGADGGKYRNTLKLYKTAEESIAALKTGEVVAVLAQQGELEGGLDHDKRFAIEPPPIASLHYRQWPVGLAVKTENEALAKALQKAMNELMEDGTIDRIMAHSGITHRRP